jgi:hypothetical protein
MNLDFGPLTPDNIDKQFCSAWLQDEIRRVFKELAEARDMFMVCELERDALRNELAEARAVLLHITSEEFPKPLCCVRAIQGQGTSVALHFDELARAYLSRYPEVKP